MARHSYSSVSVNFHWHHRRILADELTFLKAFAFGGTSVSGPPPAGPRSGARARDLSGPDLAGGREVERELLLAIGAQQCVHLLLVVRRDGAGARADRLARKV